jgi:hypothetical protein
MVVDKVGGIGPGYGPKKIQTKAEVSRPEAPKDHVTISDAALRQQNIDRVKKLALSAEDRTDKLKEVRERLASGVYDNPSDEIIGKAADQITDIFLSR